MDGWPRKEQIILFAWLRSNGSVYRNPCSINRRWTSNFPKIKI